MNCDICGSEHDAKRLPFLCAVDARNQIFEGRMKYLQLLFENESLEKEVEANAELSTLGTLRAQQLMSEDQTQRILLAAQQLQVEMKAAKAEVEKRKAAAARRRSALTADLQGLAERRAKQQKDAEKSIHALRCRWSQEADNMAEVRIFLCYEAAYLYGLRRVLKPGSKRHFEYYLGGMPILDPLDMNTLAPEIINTSLAHIVHILRLASHYLAIRLPAEIVHPHANHSLPAIYNLANSYRAHDTSGLSTPGGSNSPSASKPRPLYLYKPLTHLYKEDTTTFSFFLEGIALLMYNISWLCCSQGLFTEDRSNFEDICQMGRNLYKLFIECKPPQSYAQPASNAKNTKSRNGQNDVALSTWMGRYSHGTLYYSLNSAEGNEVIRAASLPLPMKLTDKLKRKIVGDAPGPDWEYLENDAWEIEVPDVPTESIMVETQPQGGDGKSQVIEGLVKKESKGWAKMWNA